MSSTNKTPNLNMHSWVRTDPVVCEDFNENFDKIDAAIGEARTSYGCCEIYTGVYTGTGENVHSMTFPKLPVMLLVRQAAKTSSYHAGFIADGWYFSGFSGLATMYISGNTITFNQSSTAENPTINKLDATYYYIAFASAKQ